MSNDNDNNDSWELDGNSGTNPARDFLGTTDSQPLVIRTNNVERARVAANGNVGIGANNTAPSLTLDVRGANILTDSGAQYNSHFPFTDNRAYVTGDFIFLRAGAPQGFRPALTVNAQTAAVGIGANNTAPSLTLDVRGANILTDSGAQYNSHFPFTDNNAYVTGESVFLRGGAPQGFRSVVTVNGQTGDVTIDGNLRVNGTVTSNPPKTFSIAHPLDREDKVLSHATLEGPECAVFYRGQGRLERGHARIELPDYFEALTRPEGRTVLLTPCSEQEEAVTTLAASGIKDGRFTVHAGDDRNPGQKFYWEVKAVLADVEPLEVEKLKGEESTKTSCA